MKRLLAAGALLAIFAGEASAQGWGWGPPPPPPPPGYYRGPAGPPPGAWRHARPYDWCRAKAERLHSFEYRMQLDGRISRDEARIADSLRYDLQRSCGDGRWHPNRGWHYR